MVARGLVTVVCRCSKLPARSARAERAQETQSRFFLMHQKRFVLFSATALLALAVACSKSSQTPVSPTGAQEGSTAANADGSTLKVAAPSPVSPVGGAQPDTLVLVSNKVTGKFDASLDPSYQFRIKNSGGRDNLSLTPVARRPQ